MTTTSAATEAKGLVIMLEAAGRTIGQLEAALETQEHRHNDQLRAAAAELAVEREHTAELESRVEQLEQHAAAMAHTDGEQLVAPSDETDATPPAASPPSQRQAD